MIAGYVIIAVFFLTLASIFSSAEAALSRLSRARLAVLLEEERGEAHEAEAPDANDLYLSALIARLLFSASFLAVGAWAWVRHLMDGPHAVASFAALFAGPFLILIVIGEIYSKSYGRANPDRVLIRLLPSLRVACTVFRPLRWFFSVCSRALGRLFSVRLEESPAVDVAEEVRSLALQSEQEGLIEESEKRMIEGVVSLPDVPVTRIMTPRTLMVALNANATVGRAYEVLLEKGLSRVPVYEETLDNVVGLLFAKDLLKVCSAGQADTTPVRSLMREAHFIPETKLVSQLLQEMRGHKVHMAIVLDEYGGTAGLVTHQDILEEIVGEIRDEFDRDLASPIKRVNDTTIEADALTRVDRVNALLRTKLPECDDYETVSGLLMYHLGRIPAAGERFDHGNLRVTVLEGSPRRPQRVRIEVRPRPVAVP